MTDVSQSQQPTTWGPITVVVDPTYNVSYDANGGTGSQTDPSSPYYAGVEVTVLDKGTMAKTNYHFTGWKNGGGTAYDPADTFTMPAANVILYAQWEEDTALRLIRVLRTMQE